MKLWKDDDFVIVDPGSSGEREWREKGYGEEKSSPRPAPKRKRKTKP